MGDRVGAVNEMCQVTRSKSHDHTSNNAIYKTKLEFKSPSISSHSQFNQPDREFFKVQQKKAPKNGEKHLSLFINDFLLCRSLLAPWCAPHVATILSDPLNVIFFT